MKKLSDGIAHRAFIVAAAVALAASGVWAQESGDTANAASNDTAQAVSNDDDMFGQSEVVTQAATSSKEAEGKSGFLKYDQVKVGGSFTGQAGYSAVYADPWGGSAQLLEPDRYYLSPYAQGKITITAKPEVDFGVNADIRTSWPYYTTDSVLSSATYSRVTQSLSTTSETLSIPDIDVWAFYAKFNWQDRVYFSFGKQPIAWGVSKGAFQPADDIFASSASIDLTNTTAEREGPIALKTTIPLGMTNNLYFYAGLPSSTASTSSALALSATGSSSTLDVDPADARLAVKGEYGFGNTELALAAYYCYNDHPRALIMGTTGVGSWNFFGEGVLKYGSERYFITAEDKTAADPLGLTGAKKDDQLWFTGTGGGYYMDSDSGITLIAQYLYNGEGQTAVSAKDALTYYIYNSSEMDRIKLGTHYAFASLSDSKLLSQLWGKDKLTGSIIAISNLSDLSGYVIPSLTWSFFDYLSLKLGATFSFGEAGDEYITYGVGQNLSLASLPTTPGVALNATLSIGTGSF